MSKQDTNTNDLVTFTIEVNGKQYYRQVEMLNTQEEWSAFQDRIKYIVENAKLEEMSRFK